MRIEGYSIFSLRKKIFLIFSLVEGRFLDFSDTARSSPGSSEMEYVFHSASQIIVQDLGPFFLPVDPSSFPSLSYTTQAAPQCHPGSRTEYNLEI